MIPKVERTENLLSLFSMILFCGLTLLEVLQPMQNPYVQGGRNKQDGDLGATCGCLNY